MASSKRSFNPYQIVGKPVSTALLNPGVNENGKVPAWNNAEKKWQPTAPGGAGGYPNLTANVSVNTNGYNFSFVTDNPGVEKFTIGSSTGGYYSEIEMNAFTFIFYVSATQALRIIGSEVQIGNSGIDVNFFGYATFNPIASRPGFNFGVFPGSPANAQNGDAWYDSATHTFKGYANGAEVSLSGAGGGGAGIAASTCASVAAGAGLVSPADFCSSLSIDCTGFWIAFVADDARSSACFFRSASSASRIAS